MCGDENPTALFDPSFFHLDLIWNWRLKRLVVLRDTEKISMAPGSIHLPANRQRGSRKELCFSAGLTGCSGYEPNLTRWCHVAVHYEAPKFEAEMVPFLGVVINLRSERQIDGWTRC